MKFMVEVSISSDCCYRDLGSALCSGDCVSLTAL